jgi:hypothetical protein
MINVYKTLSEKLKRRRHLRNMSVNEKWGVRMWTGIFCLRTGFRGAFL